MKECYRAIFITILIKCFCCTIDIIMIFLTVLYSIQIFVTFLQSNPLEKAVILLLTIFHITGTDL